MIHQQIRIRASLVLFICTLTALHCTAQERASTPDRNSSFDSRQAYETNVAILVKQFYIAMKQGQENELSKTIDPQYLAEHQLTAGAVHFPKIAVDNIFDIEIAADEKTVLCQVQKEAGTATIILLKLVQREGELYVRPPQGPASGPAIVTPWLLHKELAAK